MQAEVGPESSSPEELLIAHAREFAWQSQRDVDLIARDLPRVETGLGKTPGCEPPTGQRMVMDRPS